MNYVLLIFFKYLIILFNINIGINIIKIDYGDWGLGPQSPIPNPQSPIPNIALNK